MSSLVECGVVLTLILIWIFSLIKTKGCLLFALAIGGGFVFGEIFLPFVINVEYPMTPGLIGALLTLTVLFFTQKIFDF